MERLCQKHENLRVSREQTGTSQTAVFNHLDSGTNAAFFIISILRSFGKRQVTLQQVKINKNHFYSFACEAAVELIPLYFTVLKVLH